MNKSYVYIGDEIAGSYISACMKTLGYSLCLEPEEAQIVFTHCYHTSAIEDAYYETDGLIQRALPDTLLIDLSASTPAVEQELAAMAAVNNLHFVEAPLVALAPFSPDAWLNPSAMACFYACEDESLSDSILSILHALADKVVFTGKAGSAALAKAMKTASLASRVISAIEVGVMFRCMNASDLSKDALAWNREVLDEFCFTACEQDMQQAYRGAYTVALFMSDVTAAMTTADDNDLILPQLESVLRILELFGLIGGADLNLAALALLYRDEDEGAQAGLDWSRAEAVYYDDNDTVYEDVKSTESYGEYSFN